MENSQDSKRSLYLDLYEHLKQDIIGGKYPPGSMLPTEMELAESFYVSRITVQKAMQLLRKDGFITRVAGRGTFVESIPTKPQQRLIGIVLCNIASSFGLDILTGAERTAAAHGYHLIFKNSIDSPEEETKAINDLVALGAEGIIIQPIHNEYYNESLIRHHFNKFPIVLVDRNFAGFSIPGVSTNNFEAAVAATEYLFAKGHEHLAMLSSPQLYTSTVEDRINGFTSAHFMTNRPLDETNFLNNIMSPHSANAAAVVAQDMDNIERYLTENPRITALIATEATVAQLIYRTLRRLGKRIPRDYSLVMFDESDSVTGTVVTHIRQNQSEIGRIATETLLAKIADKVVSNKIYVPFEIIEGDTVKDLR